MKKIIPFSKEISFKTRIAEITDIEVTHNLEKTPQNTIEGSFLVNGTYKMTEASQIDEKFSYDLPFTIEVDEKYDLENVKIKISDFFFEIIEEDTLKVNVEVELSEVELKQIPTVELADNSERLQEVKEDNFEEARCYDQEDNILDLEENSPTIVETEEIEEIKEVNEIPSAFTNDIEDLLDIIGKRAEQNMQENEEGEMIEPIDILDSALPEALEIETAKTTEKKSNKPITDIFTSINNDEDTFKTYHVYIVRENDTLDSILMKYNVTKEEVKEYNDLNDIKIGSKLILPCSNNE